MYRRKIDSSNSLTLMSSFYLKQAGVKYIGFGFLLAGGGRQGGSVSLCIQGPFLEKDRCLARHLVFVNWTLISLPFFSSNPSDKWTSVY